MVILLNCITLGMYQPCVDDKCVTNRCKILQMFDDIIFTFFSLEMTIKMVAMGIYGKGTYLADSWNRLDCFIVAAGALEYCLNVENMNLSAIRTIRVLRPLRAINRIPSMRILVMLLLDTLPMLGNVLLLCFFVFFIFGIVGVQLWEGILRQRCFLKALPNVKYPDDLEKYFEYQGQDYICSRPDDNGMHTCDNLPPLKLGDIVCNSTAVPNSNVTIINNTTCVNWNYYYTECKGQGNNPFQATQFSETKKREMERMRLERARFHSTSTLASSTNTSEPTTCYAEIVKYIGHLWRKGKRNFGKKYRLWKYRRQQKHENYLLRDQHDHLCPNASTLRTDHLLRGRRSHHARCRYPMALMENGDRVGTTEFSENLNISADENFIAQAPRASPEISEMDISLHQCCSSNRASIQRLSIMSNSFNGDNNNAAVSSETNNSLLSPPCTHYRRRSSVMFSDVVMLHGDSINTLPGSVIGHQAMSAEHNVCSSEKMTQTGDGNVWSTSPINHVTQLQSELGSRSEAMTCQELLALSGALSAALPTGQLGRDSFLNSLAKGITCRKYDDGFCDAQTIGPNESEMYCCYGRVHGGHHEPANWQEMQLHQSRNTQMHKLFRLSGNCCVCALRYIRRMIKKLVEHKYFQQGILLAILINTLSMGIEYHNQPEELTVIVEISNIVFSAVFAIEMLLKIIAEGPFGYISNGFNVFDGIVVVLSVVELCQSFAEERGGSSSGLSVLRTFRLLRILKLVRFMPNLRRQLFVMLRTMDNVAVFFSLLVLFIFIFSILGMNLFGCKFRETMKGSSDVECDRKNFDSLLWAIVTVFQILTQEDWNVVLFNGMQKTSHWAALYFVALMTFGNYVLFNLLVAILVEGFSSERNERREREQREMAKLTSKGSGVGSDEEGSSSRFSGPHSITDSDTYTQDRKNSWQSIERVQKNKDNYCRQKCNQSWKSYGIGDFKCNIQKESKMMSVTTATAMTTTAMTNQPPRITHTAATPQDSPNTTLDPGYRDVNCRAICPTNLSFESIDRSNSQCSITSGFLNIAADNNIQKYATNNLAESQIISRRVSVGLTTFANSSLMKESCHSSPPKIRRGYSWRLSRRSSLCRKRLSQCDDEDQPGQTIILNNGRSTAGTSNLGLGTIEYMNSSGGFLHGSIRNDTQRDVPNNRSSIVTSSNSNWSPNNSIKSNSSSVGYSQSTWRQMRWIDDLSRENSLRNYDIVRARQVPSYDDESPPNTATSRTINNLTVDTLPRIKRYVDDPQDERYAGSIHEGSEQTPPSTEGGGSVAGSSVKRIKKIFMLLEPRGCLKERDDYSLYIFPTNNKFRSSCRWFIERKWFDNVILAFIGLNCITLAMERPTISSDSRERVFLSTANYIFTVVFAIEMFVKVVALGMLYGADAYFTSGWNIMDGALVIISIVDLLMSLISSSSPRIFGILRVFRLLRSLRPLRVINRAPGLKLVVQTLLSSLRPIGNIVLICCTFFIIFGILGVQLFKGAFYYCDGPDIKNVRNKTDCLADRRNVWVNRKYNFDDLGKALMSLFVLSSRDGWVNIMYTGLDAVGVDQQPEENYSEWRLLYFIAFILLVGFFVLNMFVGVVVENFHRCREEQEKEERVRRAAKRALQMEKRRRKMHEPPYYNNYSKPRLFIHNVVTSKYFDLAIAAVIGLNVVTMAMEFYMMPKALTYALKIFNYFFTAVFILESFMKILALGIQLYLKDKWNQLDIGIVILSVVGIVLEELESKIIPINPTIIRVMRVLRIARVLKLLKMAKGIRALLDTVMQALPQVGNLGLLFFLLFFIFAALGVELFGRLECSDELPCQGLGEHAHFSNFGMAFLTLFRVATGDNWNGIMKDTLRDDCDNSTDCVKNCCVSTIIAPIFFVIFVLMAQFVLVNVVVAVLMKHLEESHKHMEDELDMEMQLERELAAEQQELLDMVDEELAENENDYELVNSDIGREQNPTDNDNKINKRRLAATHRFGRYSNSDDKCVREFHGEYLNEKSFEYSRPLATLGLSKVRSLPSNFTYNPPVSGKQTCNTDDSCSWTVSESSNAARRRSAACHPSSRQSKVRLKRRQTFHSQQYGPLLSQRVTQSGMMTVKNKPLSNLSVPRLILPKKSSIDKGINNYMTQTEVPAASNYQKNKSVSSDHLKHEISSEFVQIKCYDAPINTSGQKNASTNSSNNYLTVVSSERIDNDKARYFLNSRRPEIQEDKMKYDTTSVLDVHSVINERRPSKLNKSSQSTNHAEKDENLSVSQGISIDELYVAAPRTESSVSSFVEENGNKMVICTSVKDLEAEIMLYADEDEDDNSFDSLTSHIKTISIIADHSGYMENSNSIIIAPTPDVDDNNDKHDDNVDNKSLQSSQIKMENIAKQETLEES
ncbi:hypothetical protein PV326_007002 [Microctonus aethiopoides]|nr:hypothetical protein PV326_007002 [Microctonus aethiopoides]